MSDDDIIQLYAAFWVYNMGWLFKVHFNKLQSLM